jgi:hypothetical protein
MESGSLDFPMSKVAEYQAKMIARKAAAAGLSVEAFLAAGEAELVRNRAIAAARSDRAFAMSIIARGAALRGNTLIGGRS